MSLPWLLVALQCSFHEAWLLWRYKVRRIESQASWCRFIINWSSTGRQRTETKWTHRAMTVNIILFKGTRKDSMIRMRRLPRFKIPPLWSSYTCSANIPAVFSLAFFFFPHMRTYTQRMQALFHLLLVQTNSTFLWLSVTGAWLTYFLFIIII